MAQEEEVKIEGIPAVRQELLKVFKNLKVGDLNYNKKPIILDAETSPHKAIEILLENHIRAAPVQEKNDKLMKNQLIGVLDLRDTVKFALQTYHNGDLDKAKAKAMEFLTVSPQITTQSLKYLSRMCPFHCVRVSDPIIVVLEVFAKGSHIVGVANDEGTKLLGIISQGQLFQEIAKKWTFDADVTFAELTKAKYVTSPVISIRNTAKAYEAFEKMSTANLSGLAVVNEEGKIIHNTSATDIKLWLIASNTLDESIEQFLINVRKMSLQDKYPITICTLKDGIKKAVAKLQATKYHRLWIVDQNGCPIGVLALTDIFRLIVEDHLAKKKNQDNQNDKDKKSS